MNLEHTRGVPSYPVAILAGGMATRLRPVTAAIPKALIDLNGEPFIAHQLRLLQNHGIARVVICAGYLGDMIEQCIGAGARFDLQVEYSFDGPTPLGTAGAVAKALPLLGDSFFVLYGDTYLPCDYGSVQRKFLTDGKAALMTVFRNDNRWDRSNVELVDGRIVAYDKRHHTDRMRHVDYGLGVFSRNAFSEIASDVPYDLATLYQRLLERHQLAVCEVAERFYEIGSFEGLEETRRYIATLHAQADGPIARDT